MKGKQGGPEQVTGGLCTKSQNRRIYLYLSVFVYPHVCCIEGWMASVPVPGRTGLLQCVPATAAFLSLSESVV